jgi:hypothetical protein
VKTFIIREVRKDEKAETFEVTTKYQFASIEALIHHLEANNNTLWSGEYAIEGEGRQQFKRFRSSQERPKAISPPLLDGEEGDI